MDRRDKSYAKEAVRLRTQREDLDVLLRELYVDQRFTDREIAEALGVTRTLVQDWRAEYGIDRSERKAALA